MRILEIEGYRDGGTICIVTDKGTFCIDKRIDSDTNGVIYNGYPGYSFPCEDQESAKTQLKRAIERHQDYLIQAKADLG